MKKSTIFNFHEMKNLFSSSSQIVNFDNDEDYDEPEDQPFLHKQDYFYRKIKLKFMKEKEKIDDEIEPKITIIPSQESISNFQENYQISQKSIESDKGQFLIVGSRFVQSNQSKNTLLNQINWQNNYFKNILFNPSASNETFSQHLISTHQKLLIAKEIYLDQDHLYKENLSLKNKFIKLHIVGCFKLNN